MHKLCMGMCGESRGLRMKPWETAILQSGSEEAVKGETEGEKEQPRGSISFRDNGSGKARYRKVVTYILKK